MNAAAVLPDETLAWWADRFVECRLVEQLSFERFVSMAHSERQQLVDRVTQIEDAQQQAEQQLPAACCQRDHALMTPLKSQRRRRSIPWFFRRR